MPIWQYLTVKDYREIPYWFGANHCEMTMLNGISVIATIELFAYRIRIEVERSVSVTPTL